MHHKARCCSQQSYRAANGVLARMSQNFPAPARDRRGEDVADFARRRGGEARRLVARVYDRFTEGFETPDLRAAKAFLDEHPG
jgi:predicted ATPase